MSTEKHKQRWINILAAKKAARKKILIEHLKKINHVQKNN